ncbi:MAG TPA: efflux RND transporter permease subunit, partial [Candidatus Fimivivens faecavium]|nr:efflux RND transporter permease subunit [Candidatus Fimivivens faecavium]
MNITKTVLKRPVAVLICLIALIVFGASSILSTPIELTPDMDMPVMLVLTVYPGAGPEEVEELVTSDIESAIGSLSGVKTIQSQSSENMSMVMLQYEYGTNMDTAHMDLQEKLDTIRNSLPDTVQAPTIIEMSMDMMP